MLEVPGMTEATLRTMSSHTMATLRWGLYAKALAPSATTDIDSALEGLADEEKPPNAATLQARRGRRRETLFQAQREKDAIRALLFLDDDTPDDAEGVA